MNLPAAITLHAYLRCLVLGLAGFGYALFQCYVRPPREIALKRLVLAAAFVLWAVEQLIPPGRLTLFLDDAVIAGFVLDVVWMVKSQRAGIAQEPPPPRTTTAPCQDLSCEVAPPRRG
jgi:hypothetical protein